MPLIEMPRFSNGQRLLRNTRTDPLNQKHELYVKSIHTSYTDESAGVNHGYMSALNGRLDEKNFYPDFQLKDYHIQPRQASLAGSDSMITTNTFYGNGIPNTKELPSANPANALSTSDFFPIPGCSFRWYQPFKTQVSLLQWSVFLSHNSWRGIYKDLQGVSHTKGVNTSIFLRCVLHSAATGSALVLSSTNRVLAQNMFHPQSPGGADRKNQIGPGINTMDYLVDFMEDRGYSMLGWPDDVEDYLTGLYGGLGESRFPPPALVNADTLNEREKNGLNARGGNPKYVQTEAHSATHYDFHNLRTGGLSKGFNEIRLECAISQTNTEGVYLQNFGRESVTSLTGRGYFNLIGKVGFGIRNARVLNLI